jgi:ABC-type nitrate/sulfonate/bicarbonate transport system substrate-binding protein
MFTLLHGKKPAIVRRIAPIALAAAVMAMHGTVRPQTAPDRSGVTLGPDACAGVDLKTAPREPVPIRYGLTGGGEEPLAMMWAHPEAFPNNGRVYKLEPKLYTSNDRTTALQAGQIDAGSISLTALVTGVKAGLPLRAVATMVDTNENDNQGAFVVLSGRGIASVKDWKGKRIGYYGPNTVSEYWIRSALRRAGLKPGDVSLVSMPPPAQEQALRNRQIDVAWLARQFLARASATGGIEQMLRPFEATRQRHPSTVVFFTPAFVDRHRQAYCAWRADYQRSMAEWIANRAAGYPRLIQARYLTPAAATAGPDGGRTPDARLVIADIQATVQDMIDSGFLPPALLQPAESLLLPGYSLAR